MLSVALFTAPSVPGAQAGSPEPGPTALPESVDSAAKPLLYVVQPGDNLSTIARRYNTRVEALTVANAIPNPNIIRVKQVLVIPVLPAASVAASEAGERKGLAMAVRNLDDLALLGAGWYMNWSWCSARGCVPMVYQMELPPACPPWLLVGNEPNAIPPFGGPLSPADAAVQVRTIEGRCPHTRLVVGNVSADDWGLVGGWGAGYDWLVEFLIAYRAAARHEFNQALGVHCYSRYSADYCLEELQRLRDVYGGPMWATEFGITSGDARQFEQLLAFVAAHFDRYAAYTNRQPHTNQGWELTTGVELIRPDGNLTAAGQVYADW